MCGASTRTRSVSRSPCSWLPAVWLVLTPIPPSLQRTSARTPGAARTSAATTTLGSTCVCTRASRCPRAAACNINVRIAVCVGDIFVTTFTSLLLSLLGPPCALSLDLSPFTGFGSLHRRGRVSSLRWFTTWDEWSRPSSLHAFFPSASLHDHYFVSSLAAACPVLFALRFGCVCVCVCARCEVLDSAPVSLAVCCVSYRVLYLYLYPYPSFPLYAIAPVYDITIPMVLVPVHDSKKRRRRVPPR